MRAIRIHEFGGPEVLRLEDIDEPTPGVGEVVVAVHATGVNPVDTYIRAGIYGDRPKPFTPGTDAAGVIAASGTEVGHWKVGDRVYIGSPVTGTYAEKALVKIQNIYHLPDTVSFEQGAAIAVPYATAYRALLLRGNGKAGETVLVHGASGGVGIAAVQLAVSHGLTVIGTAGTDEGVKLVRDQGAHHVLNYKDPGYIAEIQQITGDKGVNLILEMLANINLDKDLDLLAKYGRVVVIGNRGTIEINPRKTMAKDASILGMSLANALPDELRGIHAVLYAGLANSTLRPIIGKQFPLAEAANAHIAVIEGGATGKVILVP